MKYDCEGLPLPLNNKKRRPNMPKTVTCYKCGEEAEKISYGTYGCKKCKLCYQFKYGKLVRGHYSIYTQNYTDRYGCSREKWCWTYGFYYNSNGEVIEEELSKI